MPHIRFSPLAIQDLIRLHDFLVGKSPLAASKAKDTIAEKIAGLALMPEAHRPVENHPEMRDLIMGTSINSFYGELRRCAVLEILMYHSYTPVSARRTPCTSSANSEFLEVPRY